MTPFWQFYKCTRCGCGGQIRNQPMAKNWCTCGGKIRFYLKEEDDG